MGASKRWHMCSAVTDRCASYTYQQDDDSRFSPLVEAFHQSGIKDSERDGGYLKIDYTKPGQWGQTAGAGDCYIDHREDLSYALKDWRAWRKPLMNIFGGRLPWDFDPYDANEKVAGPKETNSRNEMLASLDAAIKILRHDLGALNISAESDQYRAIFAEGLKLWMHFPERAEWSKCDKVCREKILGRFDKPGKPGLVGLANYLIKAGGYGYVSSNPATVEIGPPFSFIFSFPPPEAAALLYYAFEKAGLKPVFAEIPGLRRDRFVCGMEFPVRFGAAIEFSEGFRLFDPAAAGDQETKCLIFYPMEPRQLLAAYRGNGALTAALITGQSGTPDPGMAPMDDGFIPQVQSLISLIGQLNMYNREGDDLATLRSPELDAFFSGDQSALHPLIYPNLTYLSYKLKRQTPAEILQRAAENPAVESVPGLLDYVWFVTSSYSADLTNNYATQLIEHAKALLLQDPQCFVAHEFLAIAGAAGGVSMERDRIDGHFKLAAGLLPSGHPEISRMYYQWGAFALASGDAAAATARFETASSNDSGEASWRGKARYMLSIVYAASGKHAEAAGASAAALQFAFEDLQSLDLAKAADWFQLLEKQHSVPSETAAAIYLHVAQVFLYHRQHGQARMAAERALELAPAGRRRAYLIALHEISLQEGNPAGADDMWGKIAKER